MITLDDLCAHLLPPDDRITFQSLIIDAAPSHPGGGNDLYQLHLSRLPPTDPSHPWALSAHPGRLTMGDGAHRAAFNRSSLPLLSLHVSSQDLCRTTPDSGAALCAHDNEIDHHASQHGAGPRRRCRRSALVSPRFTRESQYPPSTCAQLVSA